MTNIEPDEFPECGCGDVAYQFWLGYSFGKHAERAEAKLTVDRLLIKRNINATSGPNFRLSR